MKTDDTVELKLATEIKPGDMVLFDGIWKQINSIIHEVEMTTNQPDKIRTIKWNVGLHKYDWREIIAHGVYAVSNEGGTQ